MENYLLIAEKPDLMRKISAVYQKIESTLPYRCDFTAQAGHLVTLKLPKEIDAEKYGKWSLDEYPTLYPYKYKVINDKANDKTKLYAEIKSKIESGDYTGIIHAGDPDQEGELLVRLVIKMTRCQLPVKRFWTNDLSEESIKKALNNLKNDSEYDNLYNAASTRQKADYQFGMNLTGVVTLKMGEICNLGRVKAPIIYILSKREQEIRNYVEKITYKPAFTYKNCEFVFDNQYDTPEQATAANPNVNEAEVVEVKTEKKREKPPKLFKLSTLQVEAFKTLKMDASTTLAVLQKLYEGRLVTYPRTDCEFISTETDIEGIKNKVVKIFNFDTSLLKRTSDEVLKDKSYCNDKAIASEGHTAIIPTGLTPPENMDKRLADLYELICREFLAAFGETKETFHQVITANPRTSENPYQYKEKEDLVSGWEFILNPEYKPAVSSGIKWSKGMILNPIEFSAKECKSKPPKRFNSGSLIKLLDHPEDFEDEGGEKIKFSIGTPATRSGIIDQCIKTGYITDKKGVYYATEKAETVVNNYESVPIFQPNESGKWESYLTKIRQGEADPNAIHDTLMKEMSESVEKIKGMNSTPLKNRKGGGTVLGKCPKCGADIVSATYKSGKKGVSCTAECGMKFINRAWGKELTDTQVKMLLEGKSVQLKDLTSKEGKKYDLTLIPDGVKAISYTNKDGEQVNAFSWNFADKQDKAPLGQCPHCNGNVVMSNFGPMCENRCGMLLSNVMGKKPTEAEIKSLLAGKKTLLKGLKSKAGKPYNMYVTPTGVGERTYQKEDGSEHKGYQWTFKFEFEDNKKKK